MNAIVIDSPQKKRYCQALLDEMPVDGSMTVETKKTATDSTARQRRLQWMWNGEVANSGLGSDDTKKDVHIRAKWMFARPILLRDDDLFQIIYNKFITTITGSAIYGEYCRKFADRWISTESMSKSQRSEYLNEFQRYWLDKGVCLTDPALQGVKL